MKVRVGRSHFLEILSLIFGWSYFFAWSASFYPQNISNYKRKSVVGLNFDYMLLHFTGFIFYAIFNLTLFFSVHVQEEYEDQFPRSEIPVQLNDVVYSIHAAALTSITWIQCLIYEVCSTHFKRVYSYWCCTFVYVWTLEWRSQALTVQQTASSGHLERGRCSHDPLHRTCL